MEQSPRLSLSYVMPSQAQKHVTVNETFRRLDALTQLTVRSRTETAEPGAPAEGDAYILPSGASGTAWDDYDEANIAAFQDGAWVEIAAVEGLRAFVADDGEFVVYDGAAWSVVGETAAKFGVNAGADATNRLTVKSDAVLFSHDDVTPGSGDARVKVNKDAAGNTASHLFQTGFSGRAEFGLTGDDDFHVKVSPDGAAWTDAIWVDKDTGYVGFSRTDAPSPISAYMTVGGSGSTGTIVPFTITTENATLGVVFEAYRENATQNTASAFFQCKAAHGTKASPSDVADGNWLGGFAFQGYASGAFGQYALINVEINGTVSGTTVPADIVFRCNSSAGTFGFTERMRILSSGEVGIGEASPGALLHVDGGGILCGNPTGGDKGTGAINAEAVYDDNALLSCYVFDQALDGAIDAAKWDGLVPDRVEPPDYESVKDPKTGDVRRVEKTPRRVIARAHGPMRKFAARIGGNYDPLTLDGYAKHWKEKRHLTSMPNEAAFDPEKGVAAGEWIQRLVETVEIQAVLIEQLNSRVKALEAA